MESERIKYKAGWNPDAILRTVCAFANDFANRSKLVVPSFPGPDRSIKLADLQAGRASSRRYRNPHESPATLPPH